MKVFPKIVKLGAVVCLLFVVLGLFGRYHWFLDLFAHFRVQYIIGSLVLSILLFLTKARWMTVLMAVTAVLLGASLWPYYVYSTPENVGDEYKVISYNVNTSSTQYKRVLEFLRHEDADIVFLMEVDGIWLRELEVLKDRFPFSVYHPRDDNFGFALLSKHPLSEQRIEYFSEVGVPSVTAKVEMAGAMIDFIGTHPVPPVGAERSAWRNEQIRGLQEHIASEPTGFLLVAGDFNATPWSFIMKDFFEVSQTHESSYGRGVRGTWFRQLFFITIPVDYIVGNRGISFQSHRLGEPMGSDHSPIIATFTLQEAN